MNDHEKHFRLERVPGVFCWALFDYSPRTGMNEIGHSVTYPEKRHALADGQRTIDGTVNSKWV